MRIAPVVILLARDAGGGSGSAIAPALLPTADSNLRRETCPLEISLDKYGIREQKAGGDLIQFVDPHGSPQVTIFLVDDYEPPVAACAINEILALLASDDMHGPPTVVVPIVMNALNRNQDTVNPTSCEQDVTLFSAEIGTSSGLTQEILAKTARPPLSLWIPSEPLACFVHMVRVLQLPTVLVIASNARSRNKSTPQGELEAICEVGKFLASRTGLFFCKDKIQLEQVDRPRVSNEPWRALYG